MTNIAAGDSELVQTRAVNAPAPRADIVSKVALPPFQFAQTGVFLPAPGAEPGMRSLANASAFAGICMVGFAACGLFNGLASPSPFWIAAIFALDRKAHV